MPVGGAHNMTVSWHWGFARGAAGVNSMMAVLLLAGISLLLGGLLTVALGIQLELSFGNTLLLAGAIVSCTGVMMLGLWLAVRELKNVARQLGGLPAEARAETQQFRESNAPLDQREPENGGGPFDLDQAMSRPAVSVSRRQESAFRERGGSDPLSSQTVETTPPAAKPRRNLLFSSSSRKERERSQARATEPSPVDPQAAPPLTEPGETPPANFEDTWRKSERGRAGDEPRRSGRAAATRDEDQPPVTVLKSGVVDGMAYSLYSDGSIEAQMPEGMMRFASIDELRAHLDQRS
jgi:hypothetical protein